MLAQKLGHRLELAVRDRLAEFLPEELRPATVLQIETLKTLFEALGLLDRTAFLRGFRPGRAMPCRISLVNGVRGMPCVKFEDAKLGHRVFSS